MLSRALLALYFCVISSNLCLAAEWSWAAPNDGKGLTLVTNGEAYPASTVDNKPVIGPPPNPDFMNRRGVAFRVDDTAAAANETLFVLIEHLDVNIGSIQVTYDSALPPDNEVAGNNPYAAAAGAVAGHMALGSSTPKLAIFSIRSAAFQHRQPGGADFEVQGVSSIAKVTLTTEISEEQRTRALAAREKRGPKRVNLQRPMQLVVGAGGDAATPDGLAGSQEAMRYQCPVFEMLGFTAVESYVKWNFVEPERGKWDWSFYDGVVDTAGEFGLKWFPLLIVGSAYSLPDWYFNSPENTGFVCLEHGIRNNVQTIYNEN